MWFYSERVRRVVDDAREKDRLSWSEPILFVNPGHVTMFYLLVVERPSETHISRSCARLCKRTKTMISHQAK